MKHVLMLLLILLALSACTTIDVKLPPGSTGGSYQITINANKEIPFTGTVSPSGNTVPVTAP
ncbi:MAG: hypothetical protein AB9919_06915 [Geobacteraceae bacterium]